MKINGKYSFQVGQYNAGAENHKLIILPLDERGVPCLTKDSNGNDSLPATIISFTKNLSMINSVVLHKAEESVSDIYNSVKDFAEIDNAVVVAGEELSYSIGHILMEAVNFEEAEENIKHRKDYDDISVIRK